jgi:hypothetical protein
VASFSFSSTRFAQLFTNGWSKPETDNQKAADKRLLQQSLEVSDAQDGSHIIDTTHYHSPSLAVESSFQQSSALVNEYRAMALDLDVDAAIDDIVNAIVTTDEDEQAVDVNLDGVEGVSEQVKTKIKGEFKNILHMMDFDQTGYEKVRQWYIDGRQYWQIVVDDKNKKAGIQRLIHLDPRAMKRIKQVQKEYGPDRIERITGVENFYLYNTSWSVDTSFGNGVTPMSSSSAMIAKQAVRQTLRIPANGIAFVHSGILSPDGNMVFSHLEKSRKPLNNLKMMRDALVIYRITRAPERRVFYVDVGSLPPKSAESYVVTFMNKNKSKMSYDSVTGKVNGHSYQSTMLEDFWMPRREGGRGTEVDTLQGAQNLGQIDDILYFQKLLFRSLNVPIGRLESDNSSAVFGSRGAEITRDEWKFNKFVQRLRRRYSKLFSDILGTHLQLQEVVTKEEWESMVGLIRFDYASDSFVKSQQEDESLNSRMASAASAEAIVGKYVSKEWVQRNILKMSDDEIASENKKIEKEAPPEPVEGEGGDSPFGQ